MALYRIDWHASVTPGITSAIARAAGVTEDLVNAESGRIARILANLSFSDLFEAPANQAALESAALGMLQDAALWGLKSFGLTWCREGHYEQAGRSGSVESLLVPMKKTDVNLASAEELERLPFLGATLARRIIAERESAGPFLSIENLAERVAGIGPDTGEGLRWILSFSKDSPPDHPFPSAGFEDIFSRFCNLQPSGPSPESRLRSALRWLATHTAAATPPAAGMHDRLQLAELPALSPATAVGVLWGAEYYYKLLELIENASVSICVAMFHAALPQANHPTRMLLDALVAAHARGVDVKVLLDQDRASDPYKSTVINQAAIGLLAGAGVAVRVDKPDRLLHSKVVLVDDQRLVIGSHNWTAGSYFHGDDLSLVITGDAAAGKMRDRFDALWANSIAPQAQGDAP